jgi:redox-sensing transcriptional repressor
MKLDIPKKSIYRLSLYQRSLEKLRANTIETVSSEALAKATGVKPTQLRKDLAYFGQLGVRGMGYQVDTLYATISGVLGSNKLQPVILVGVGNLGSALLRYAGFRKEGFEVVAAFDSQPKKKIEGITLPIMLDREMPSFIRSNQIKMAILTVPAEFAQNATNTLVSAGIQAILNFSTVVLEVPENVVVNNVDLAVELENLSYFIRQEKNK